MNEKERIKTIESVVKIVDKLTPYMPPALEGVKFICLQENTLYMSTIQNDDLYQSRLEMVLKEEFNFIEKVKFVQGRNKDE